MLPTYACIRQIYLAQHYFRTSVVHREEILIFPCLFMFQVSFSNLLRVEAIIWLFTIIYK